MDKQRRVIALGFFDGVHLGHGALLRRVAQRAKELDALPCAFTFDRSPAAALTGRAVPLLTGVDDRAQLMEALYGIREVVVAPFQRMRQMDWQDFVGQYLQEELGAVHVVAGHDFHFGYKGEGNPRRLADKCVQLGMGCDVIPRVELDGVTISSTHIRTLVEAGELEQAARFLGHPHILSGAVVHGNEIGRTLGSPTANLPVPQGVIAPGFGVYATRVRFDGEVRAAVTNVGVRPTVADNDGRVTVEGFILDFDGDLYSHQVRMEFHKRLRGERKFPSMEALAEEIRRNAEQTRDFFGG